MTSAVELVPPVGKGMQLSLYDEHRRPHIAITDNTEVIISPRSLNSELCCPICLDLLKTTMTTKECLHRFCQECITTALMRGNKECPTCRKKLVSKRSLRPDPNFDALIQKIYPNRDEYDAIQERALQRFNRQFNNEVLQRTIEQGMFEQAANRRQRVPGSYEYEKRPRKKKTAAGGAPVGVPHTLSGGSGRLSDRESSPEHEVASENSAALNNEPEPSGAGTNSSEIELILKASDALLGRAEFGGAAARLTQTRYLKTCLDATVEHLCKYLSIRAQLDHLPTSTAAADAEDNSMQNDDDVDGERTPAQPLTLAEVAHDHKELDFKVAVASHGPGGGDHHHSGHQFTELPTDLTLAEVRLRFWSLKRPLELVFDVAADSEAASRSSEET